MTATDGGCRPQVVLVAAALLVAACGATPSPPVPPAASGPLTPSPPPPSPSPSPTPFPVACSWLPPHVCERILAAALGALGGRDRPVAAWFGPPIEEHFPLVSPSFRGTVLFQLPDGSYRLVLVNYVAGEGIGAFGYEGSIPPWYPLPTATPEG